MDITRTLTIPGYGFRVTLYEASLYELEELNKTLDSDDLALFPAKLLSFIKEWDCKDRSNQSIPLTPDGLRMLPQSVLGLIIKSIREPFTDDDLKNVSGSPLTSQPEPQVKQ